MSSATATIPNPLDCHRSVNGGADARERSLREKGCDRVCDGQPAQGAQRPERGDMAGPADRLRGRAG